MTTLDVTDYGAVGDGSSDDRAAIQAAIDDAAAGDTVYLPATSEHYLVEYDKNTVGQGFIEIRGDSHADDITLSGDGPNSEIRAGTYDSNAFVVRVAPIDSGISGIVIRDLTVHGNDTNQPNQDAGHRGIRVTQKDSTASIADVGVTVKNVHATHLLETALSTKYGNVQFDRCTVTDTTSHGFSASDESGNSTASARQVFTNCLTRNVGTGDPGRYGFDMSGGYSRMEDCVSVEDPRGMKCGPEHESHIMRRFRVNGTTTGPAVQRPTSDNTVDWIVGDMVLEGAQRRGLNLEANDDWTIEDGKTVLCVGNSQESSGSGRDIEVYDDPSLSAANATVYVVDSGASVALDWQSGDEGSLGAYYYDNNVDEDLRNNGNLSITESGNGRKTDLSSVPAASDIGAWSGDSTDDSTDNTGFDSWTPRWAATTDDWSVVEGTAFEGGHALEFDHSGTERTRYALSWDKAGAPADVEVLDRFRVQNFTDDSSRGFHARLHLRSSLVDGAENGYWLEAETPQDAFRLAKYTNGGLTTLARFGTPVENTFYYRRFRAEGNTLQVKVWPAGESEPDAWDVEVTDTDHADGWVGMGSYDPQPTETDVFSVGTGGESAPLSPGDDAPTVGWVDPNDGATVTGDVAVRLDASDPEDADDSLTVEYRVGDGAWTTASYDSGAGSYVATWDSSSVPDGGHTLSARATDSAGNTGSAAVDVTVANDLAVETVDAGSVTETAATLVGNLSSLGDSASATGAFEYRERGADTWTVAGEQTLETTGQFDAEVTGLSAGTGCEFRAVATADDSDAGATLAFDTATADGTTSLSIDRFDAADDSNPAWSRFDVDWAVSDADGELNTVITELRYGGVTVAAESTNVTGSRAAHSHELRVKGPVDEVWLGVNDTANEIVSESKNV